jgi:hypothetical protein
LASNEFDKDLFEKYVMQIFHETFENELNIIDSELKKYTSENTESKQLKKLECFITINHTSAHARGVAGVCVSGDNPLINIECQWNMQNYLQMVLRDKDTKICQGLILLHSFEERGKKILTASFNPSNTYLYKVDEEQLFIKLLEQLSIFVLENNFDMILTSQNKRIRTNRTGGVFEKAIQKRINKIDKSYHFDTPRRFSVKPEYWLKEMDVVWEKI